jgi:hypothetical protein
MINLSWEPRPSGKLANAEFLTITSTRAARCAPAPATAGRSNSRTAVPEGHCGPPLIQNAVSVRYRSRQTRHSLRKLAARRAQAVLDRPKRDFRNWDTLNLPWHPVPNSIIHQRRPSESNTWANLQGGRHPEMRRGAGAGRRPFFPTSTRALFPYQITVLVAMQIGEGRRRARSHRPEASKQEEGAGPHPAGCRDHALFITRFQGSRDREATVLKWLTANGEHHNGMPTGLQGPSKIPVS